MKWHGMRLGMGIALLAALTPAARSEDPAARPEETTEQRDARMHWWREAKFGLFIHWGVYSVPAGTYDGKQIGGIGEWIMNRGRIPVARYAEYAKEFNPVKFNADEWVRLAKNAGQKYIVITSKHHDGFAMYHSKVSPYNIYDATPFQRDPLAELAAACRNEGLQLGFYYSQAQDWHHPGGAAHRGHWDPAQDGDMLKYIETIAVPQVRELLSNYGEFPAVLWWDTPMGMNQPMADKLLQVVRELKPRLIMNNRLGGGFHGDTETTEQHIPAQGFKERDWETCMTMNDTWGFKSYDQHWKSTEDLIRKLVDIVSKGGNFLLNVGPTAEGLIPEPSVERLQQMGQWLKVNGEAIYATTASPFSQQLDWGRCTKRLTPDGATLYLHVFAWPKDGKLTVPALKNTVTSAYLLADAEHNALPTAAAAGGGVTVELPAMAPDPISSTVVLKIKGAPDLGAQSPEEKPTGKK